MGVFASFCQACGLSVQRDHWNDKDDESISTIYREDPEDSESSIHFGPEHDWLKNAVAVRIESHQSLYECRSHYFEPRFPKKTAFRFYHLAAEKSYLPAYVGLGALYEGCNGIAKDYQESARFYRLAAAYLYLGYLTELGLGRAGPTRSHPFL